MPSLYKKSISKHSDEQIFAVVNNISAYPDFIEWCEKVNILLDTETTVQAELYLKKGALNYSFATENSLIYPSSMQMRLLSGPFKRFIGEWTFKALPNNQGCEVEFSLEYEFSNRLLGMTAGSAFHLMADDMVKIFLERADALYGK
jgi:ribosome-associated toxin RatA of RatAB toxin-antitoxin module